jgi:hypothetical protein
MAISQSIGTTVTALLPVLSASVAPDSAASIRHGKEPDR